MKLNATGFERFLNRPDPSVFIALVYGIDSGQVSERVLAIKRCWLSNSTDDFSTSVFSSGQLAKEQTSLIDEMSAYTLTGGARIVHLKQPDNSDAKSVITALTKFQSGSPPVAKLIIEAGALTTSNTLRKTVEKAKTGAVSLACYPDKPHEIGRTCNKTISDAGYTIEPAALNLLISSIPADRRILQLELEKLLCYVADRKGAKIQLADIQAVISQAGDSSVDKLIFACVEGRKNDADQILKQALEAGQAPVMIVRAICRYLYRLHNIACATKKGEAIDSAMAKLRPPVFIMHKELFTKHCALWSISRLEKALKNAIEAERDLKSALGTDHSILGRFILATSSLSH